MTDKPAVLIATKSLGRLAPMLSGRYDVYCLWDAPPVEAEQAVRAIVMMGDTVLDTHLLDRLPNLGLISCVTVGYEGVDLDDVARRGLQICNGAGANHEDVADHALALMLAERRKVVIGDGQVRGGEWVLTERLMSRSLTGQSVGIMGLGRIGAAVARRCEAFGMTVRWWGPNPKPDAAWPRVDTIVRLAAESDVLVVCAGLNEDNRAAVDGPVLDALGPGGLLVNIARGGLVDEAALLDRLKSGALGGAALDVFEIEPTPAERWAGAPNVVLTPHIGGATDRAVQNMAAILFENLALFFAGQPLKTPIPT